MTDPRHALGRRGEDLAAAWLTRCGWTILARRRRSPNGGEVDILALDPDAALVAIEVRTRRASRTGAAAATLDARRLRRLASTLLDYAGSSTVPHRSLRVDLVTIEPLRGEARSWRIRRLAGIGSW